MSKRYTVTVSVSGSRSQYDYDHFEGTLYTQTVESLDLRDLIDVVNNAPKPIKVEVSTDTIKSVAVEVAKAFAVVLPVRVPAPKKPKREAKRAA